LIRWNDNEKELTGYSTGELMDMNILDLFREDRDIVAKAIGEVFSAGRATVEARLVTKSGASIPFSLSGLRISMDNKQYLVGVGLDISQRKQLEDQLRQSQKTASIGTLEGGIVDDFNDILTAVIDSGNLPDTKVPINDSLKDGADQILTTVNHPAQLTKCLHASNRKQITSLQPVDLNDIARKLGPFLMRLTGEDIELVMDLTDKDVMVQADPVLIEQVLMNLATNARDAMPDGGTLHIRIDCIDPDDKSAMTHPCGKSGKYAMISVADSGTSMDGKAKQRTLEPSFTDKEDERGMELATVYDIIKQHNGSIEVMNGVNRDTTVAIFLPAIQTSCTEEESAGAVFDKEGRETILVAEDDETVRWLAKDVLEEFGYAVVLAEDGEDALKKFGANGKKIQLLLLGMTMPKMNGKETYEEIKSMTPDIKAIFLSGHAEDLSHKKWGIEEGLNIIIKPFSVTALLDKVRLVLDS
jgi:PAS domain S-box-containing protein